MKSQKLLAILFIYLSLTPVALGMENLRRAFSSNKSNSQFLSVDDINTKRINRIINKKNIKTKTQIELALLCLMYPIECRDKNLFQKISPNLVLSEGKSFVETLLLNRKSKDDYTALLLEAFKQEALDPHLRGNNEDSDLALEILKTADKDLVSDLLKHPQFNPNSRYGEFLYPLATMLFLTKNYITLFIIMSQKSFSSEIRDKNGHRPGYHMLANYSEDIDKNCFLAFMGNLEAWNLRGLGLNIPKHLDQILRISLQNNEDRLLVFKKFIEQLCIYQEGINLENNYFLPIRNLLSVDKELGSHVYINKEFTHKAISVLVNYKITTEKITNGIHRCSYWGHNGGPNISDFNIASVREARHKHLVVSNNNSCTICLEEFNGMGLKSTIWCDHVFCAECLLTYSERPEAKEEMLCPSRECIFPVPPSLILALATVNINSDEEFLKLKQIYESCCNFQERASEETLNAIPGLSHCPACKVKFIIDIKKKYTRTIRCHHCDKKIVIAAGDTKEIMPFSAFTDLGQCQSCNTPLDKISGCSSIFCPICKDHTTWIPLKNQ